MLVCFLGEHRNSCFAKGDRKRVISHSPLHFPRWCDDEDCPGQIREFCTINQLHVICESEKGSIMLVRDLCRGDILSLWIVVAVRSSQVTIWFYVWYDLPQKARVGV